MQQVKSTNTFAKFHVLLASLPGVNKNELVWQYSGLLTTSLKEFYETKPYEFRRMIDDMQRIVNEMGRKKTATPDVAELKRLRSAVLHRLQKYGIDTTDWSRVNAFMRNPRIAGKTLGEMSIDELTSFIPKMQSILAKDKAVRDEHHRLCANN